jgi:hypothetical protein
VVTVVVLVSLGVATPASAETVTPKAFAQRVCPAYGRLVTAIGAIDDSVQGARTQAEVAHKLTGALEDVIRAAGRLVKQVRRVGAPDTKGGARTARLLVEEFRDFSKEFKGAQADAIFLEFTPEEDFAAAVTALQQRIQQAVSTTIQRVAADIDPAVSAAFDANKSCAATASQ